MPATLVATPLLVHGLDAGEHTVGLGNVAEKCPLQGEASCRVQVSEGETTQLGFEPVRSRGPPH